MIKKLPLLSIVLFFLVTAICGSQILDQPVAMVNYTTPEMITKKQLENATVRLKQQYQQAGQQVPPRERILEELMIQKLISQAAQKEGITVTDSEVIAAVRQQVAQSGLSVSDSQLKQLVYQQTGLSWEEYVKQSKSQLLAQKYVKQKKRSLFENINPPTESEVREIYEANSHLFINPEMVRFSQIYRDTRNLSAEQKRKERELMEEIHRKLKNGAAKFEEMAMQYSDDKELRYQGGDVGYLARNDVNSQMLLGKNFFRIAFSTDTGEITPIIESNIGLHILKITKHLDKRFLDLDDPVSPESSETVRQRIINLKKLEAQQKLFQKAVGDIVDELADTAEIRIIQDSIDVDKSKLKFFAEFVE
jgi:parvulin-like peptidyl-prolyl isomerase